MKPAPTRSNEASPGPVGLSCVLLVNRIKHLLGNPQPVHPDRPAAVVGQMNHDLLDFLTAEANVERSPNMHLEFRAAAQDGQGGDRNH